MSFIVSTKQIEIAAERKFLSLLTSVVCQTNSELKESCCVGSPYHTSTVLAADNLQESAKFSDSVIVS